MNSFFKWIKAFIFWSNSKKTLNQTKEQEDLERWIIEFEKVTDKV